MFEAPRALVPVEWRRQRRIVCEQQQQQQQAEEDERQLSLPALVVQREPPAPLNHWHVTNRVAPPPPPLPPPPIVLDQSQVVDQCLHSLPTISAVRTGRKKVENRNGLFRQILSDDDVFYDEPLLPLPPPVHPPPPPPRPPPEAIYEEPSLVSSRASATDLLTFRRSVTSLSSNGYADPFDRFNSNSSVPDHAYERMLLLEELDDDEQYGHLSLGPHSRPSTRFGLPKWRTTFSSLPSSDTTSQSGRPDYSSSAVETTIPVGLARSRAAMFESMARANGSSPPLNIFTHRPQLALYSLNSLPPLPPVGTMVRSTDNSVLTTQLAATTRSCPASLTAQSWTVESSAYADNDEFFMEFANQRITRPSSSPVSRSLASSISSSSSTKSSCSSNCSSGSNIETESSTSYSHTAGSENRTKRRVSFLSSPIIRSIRSNCYPEGDCKNEDGCDDDEGTESMGRFKGKTDTLSRTSSGSLGRLNLARFFKHTLNALGGPCRGQGLQPSDQEDVDDDEALSVLSSDDLLSHSDLEMFRKPDDGDDVDYGRQQQDDSGADVTTPLPDIDSALDLLEMKARVEQKQETAETTTTTDESDSTSTTSSSCDDDDDPNWDWSSSCSSSSTTTRCSDSDCENVYSSSAYSSASCWLDSWTDDESPDWLDVKTTTTRSPHHFSFLFQSFNTAVFLFNI